MLGKGISANRRVGFYDFVISLIEGGQNIQTASAEVRNVFLSQSEGNLLMRLQFKREIDLYGMVSQGLRNGYPLYKVLDGKVPQGEIMMLLAGERGDLIKGLKAARKEATDAQEIRQTLIKAITYPIIIFMGIIGLMWWLGNTLLPGFADMIPVREWAPAQQSMYWYTTHIHIWVPIALAIIAAIIGVVVLINRYLVGQPREYLHPLPPFNVIRKMTSASLLSTLANLIMAGEPIKESLERMQRTSRQPYLTSYLRRILTGWRSGAAAGGPGKALAVGLFTPWTLVELEIYGKGRVSDFAERMVVIADNAREDAKSAVNGLSKLINMLMMGAGGFVIAYSVITMYGITSTLMQ